MSKAIAARAKNEASPADVAKLMRANVISLDASKFCVLDLDEVATNFRNLLVDLCGLTARPTSALLQAAGKLAFEGASSQELKMFGDRISDCVSHCRKKVSGSTSGAKLCPAVKAIGTLLKQMGGADLQLATSTSSFVRPTLGQQLLSRARVLQRKKSDEEEAAKISSPVKKPRVESNMEIMALYGLKALPRLAVSAVNAQVCISSSDSEEPEESPQRLRLRSKFGNSSSSSAYRGPPSDAWLQDMKQQLVEAQYVDRSNCTLVRLLKSGDKIVAQMQKGADGFLVGIFPGETQTFPTEIPNLMIDPPAKKLVVMKRPAGRLQKPVEKVEDKETVEDLEEDSEEEDEDEEEEEEAKEDEAKEQPEAEERESSDEGTSAPETVDYGDSPVFHGKFLTLVKSDKSGQSYIRGGKPASLRKDYKLVVAVSKRGAEAVGLDHKVVAQSLFDRLCAKDQFRKNYAVNLRDKALA